MPAAEFELINNAAAWLGDRFPVKPKVGIILGTGLGSSIDSSSENSTVLFNEVPGLLPVHVTSHAGKIYLANMHDVPVIIFSGRAHYYEGHEMHEIIRSVRIMHAMGCTHLVVTNASGGINPAYRAGDTVLIRDHINFPQVSPLRGMHDERWGPRFPDMSEPYSKRWIEFIRQRTTIETGVYALTIGPNLETPAEYIALQRLGADLVGMSTVAEVIAARQLNMEVLGISVVANMGLPHGGSLPVTEAEIIANVAAQDEKVKALIALGVLYCRQ